MHSPVDLVFGARQHLMDLLIEDKVSIQVTRRTPTEAPSGKIRWAIEIEEPDRRSESAAGRHPKALLVFERSLQELYGICLEQFGCKVESASDNDEAMKLYCEHGPYDVVLTDIIHFVDLFNRIREENSAQAIAIVGSCGATSLRLHYKIPVLREGPSRQQLVRLVESAIKREVRILMVAGGAEDGLEHVVWNLPMSFEIELESNWEEALKRYRERGPYDMVLIGVQHPAIENVNLALAIRRENSAQRIALFAEKSSPAMRRYIKRKLGDVPVLMRQDLYETRTLMSRKGRLPDGEGQAWLDTVNLTTATAKKRSTPRVRKCQ